MTIESAIAFTEDSIQQCRDFLSFLKRRQQVELDYAKSLKKLFDAPETAVISRTPSGKDLSLGPDYAKKSTLWYQYSIMMDDLEEMTASHKRFAVNLNAELIEPLVRLIKQMEINRKQIVDESVQHTKQLQETYTAMKKTKQVFDECQTVSSEATNLSQRKVNQPHPKGKDIEKLNSKASIAQEKAYFAFENFRVCEEACKKCQEAYFTEALPRLLEHFKLGEAERCVEIFRFMKSYNQMEISNNNAKIEFTNSIEKRLSQIDLAEDIEVFTEEHILDPKAEHNELSVRSLVHPSKTARMSLLVDSGSWKSRYCVLMGEEKKLYIFEDEDSLKPRVVIDLQTAGVFNVHESCFDKPNTFQIAVRRENFQQFYYFQAESAKERLRWFKLLGYLVYCCALCKTSKTFSFGEQVAPQNISAVLDSINTAIGSSQTRLDNGSGYFTPSDGTAQKLQPPEEGFRIYRRIRLGVIEARDLPSSDIIRKNGYYCVVLLNGLKSARTVSIWNSTNPFWGEEFSLSDIPECVDSLKIVLYSQRPLQKDVEIGSLDLELSQVEGKGKAEDWINLKGPDSQPTLMAMRISILLTNEKTLALSEYQPIIDVFMDKSLSPIDFVSGCVQSREELAHILVNIYSSLRMDLEFIKLLVQKEMQSTDNPNVLFRGNSLATKVIDYYMKLLGSTYLNNTLGDIVRTVYKSKDSCEIDVSRLDRPDDGKKNLKRLLAYVSDFWEIISNSTERFPLELKDLFQCVRETAAAKYEKEQMKYLAVSGFVFLRFFCPAILNPKLFGMMDDHPDANTSRTLTLIAKTLQNLANLTDFMTKEPHMIVMNGFISINLDSMKQAIVKLSTKTGVVNSRAVSKIPTSLNRDVASLVYLLSDSILEIRSYNGPQNELRDNLKSQIERLNDVLATKETEWKAYFVENYAENRKDGQFSVAESRSITQIVTGSRPSLFTNIKNMATIKLSKNSANALVNCPAQPTRMEDSGLSKTKPTGDLFFTRQSDNRNQADNVSISSLNNSQPNTQGKGSDGAALNVQASATSIIGLGPPLIIDLSPMEDFKVEGLLNLSNKG